MGDIFVDGDVVRPDFDLGKSLITNFVCETLDLFWPGSGPEEGLTVLLKLLGDGFDLGDETHVEHTVSFVEDEEADFMETDAVFLHKVNKTTRSGNENIATSVKFLFLSPGACSSINHSHIYSDAPYKGLGGVLDLDSELSGRSKHQG